MIPEPWNLHSHSTQRMDLWGLTWHHIRLKALAFPASYCEAHGKKLWVAARLVAISLSWRTFAANDPDSQHPLSATSHIHIACPVFNWWYMSSRGCCAYLNQYIVFISNFCVENTNYPASMASLLLKIFYSHRPPDFFCRERKKRRYPVHLRRISDMGKFFHNASKRPRPHPLARRAFKFDCLAEL